MSATGLVPCPDCGKLVGPAGGKGPLPARHYPTARKADVAYAPDGWCRAGRFPAATEETL